MQLDRDSLYQVLLNLPVDALGQYCKTSREANAICQNDSFWQEKIKHDFPGANTTNRYLYHMIHKRVKDITNYLFRKYHDYKDQNFFRKPIFPLEVRENLYIEPNVYIAPKSSFERKIYPGNGGYIYVTRNRGDPSIRELIATGKAKVINDNTAIIREMNASGNYITLRHYLHEENISSIQELEKLGLTTRIN